MRLGLNGVLAQYYSDAISDNVRRRLDQKLRDGEWIGQAPFGYKNVDLDNGKKWVEKDLLKAEAVLAAYQWYGSGNYSLKLIKQKIQEEYGFVLGISQLDLILKNPFYMGEMRVKGKLYPHKYDRIITEDLYEKAETVRQGYAIKPMQYAGLPYAYRSLITCEDCGCKVTFEKKKSQYVYGHCTQYRRKHGAAYVPEDEFTKQLLEVFKSIAMPQNAYEEVTTTLTQEHEAKMQTKAEAISRLDAEIEKYSKRIERIYDDYIDDLITKETYERKHQEFLKAQKKLDRERTTFELIHDEQFDAASHLLRLSRNAPNIFKKANFEQKRALVNMVLSNLRLKGNLLRWELKKPYDTMALCAVSGNWLRGLDSNQRPSG